MGPIGVFDSGYGGLTILRELHQKLPQYDFMYLGDNARSPYGTRSYQTVYQYTRQCVKWLFSQGCPLVILACNTASAKALRTIQQKDLPGWDPHKRVLGVIRPTAEIIGTYSQTGTIGILATKGTVHSESYLMEMSKFFPQLKVFQQACALWVPIIENGVADTPGADYFIKEDIAKLLSQNPDMDTVLLGCTHYPLIAHKIKSYLPEGVQLISQGEIVADSLQQYLKRHVALEQECAKRSNISFFTTDLPCDFDKHSSVFYGAPVRSQQVDIGTEINLF